MPLLPQETEIFPVDLFSLTVEGNPWGVAHVRSRQEKVLARYLTEHEIPFYLPATVVRRTRAGRNLTSRLPLFPGYVFHRAATTRYDLIRRSNVVANLIEVDDQQQLHEELSQLRRLQESGASLRLHQELVIGQAVRIVEGAFAGYSGVVERGKGNDRLVVRVSMLKQAVSVELDRDVLQRARALA